jgi:hypothetical protein
MSFADSRHSPKISRANQDPGIDAVGDGNARMIQPRFVAPQVQVPVSTSVLQCDVSS